MRILEILGRSISKRPWAYITTIVVITIVMGYFSQYFEQSTEENAFTPDDEVSRANTLVNEEFGSSIGRISILIKADTNVLDPGSILAQIDISEGIFSSEAERALFYPPDGTSPVLSPASVLVQSLFYVKTMEVAPQLIAGMSSNMSCLEEEKLMNAFISKGFSLTHDEMRTVIQGGEILMVIDCFTMPVVMTFDPYDPSDISYLMGSAPMARSLEFILSKDFDPGPGSSEKGLISISLRDDLEPSEKLRAEKEIDAIVGDIEVDGISFITIGDELLSERISEASGRSMGILFLLALVMVIVVLVFVFRDAFEIAINVIALFMAVIWVFGAGGMLGFDNNPSLTTVPVLVIALGIDYGIHLTLRYREEVRKGKKVREAVSAAEASVGFAILLATVTTLVGFLSSVTASSPGIRVFGILNAVGILSAFVIMMTFVPAARVLRDRRKERLGRPLVKERGSGNGIWGWAGDRARRLGIDAPHLVKPEGSISLIRVLSSGSYLAMRPYLVLPVVLLMTGVGIYGGIQLEAQFDFRDFLPSDLEITSAVRSVVDDFDFSSEEAYILIEGDVSDPAVLYALVAVKERAVQGKDVVSAQQFGSVLELGRSLSDPSSPSYDPDFSETWHLNLDRDFDSVLDDDITRGNVSAVYDLMLDTYPDRASRLIIKEEEGYNGMVMRIPVNSRGGSRSEQVRDQVIFAAGPLKELEGGPLKSVTPTGAPLVQQAVLESIAGGQIRSVGVTFIVSLIILTLIFLITRRSLFLGMMTLLPLVMVIAWTTGGMHYFGIPLNVVTVTISAITVGLGIDYGIHITQRFLEDIDRISDPVCALSAAVSHTGSALFGSMMTTVIGFAILSFAIIPPLAQFGQVTAISVLFAFLASVFVLPTLLILWLRGNHIYRRKFKGEEIAKFGKECLDPGSFEK